MVLAPLTAACLVAAAGAYQLPPTYLYAILATEGGRVGQAVANPNGTSDLGPFQVNTIWGPAIARYWHVSIAQALERVRDDGCANAVIASAILRREFNQTRGDLPKALGFYHSHSASVAEPYRRKVLSVAEALMAFRRGD